HAAIMVQRSLCTDRHLSPPSREESPHPDAAPLYTNRTSAITRAVGRGDAWEGARTMGADTEMPGAAGGAAAAPYAAQVRWVLQAAMVLFIYTVVVGILNGVDAVDFERKPLVAHLHVGTLGWLTMATFAASLTLFGSSDPRNKTMRRMAVAA